MTGLKLIMYLVQYTIVRAFKKGVLSVSRAGSSLCESTVVVTAAVFGRLDLT